MCRLCNLLSVCNSDWLYRKRKCKIIIHISKHNYATSLCTRNILRGFTAFWNAVDGFQKVKTYFMLLGTIYCQDNSILIYSDIV